MRVRLYIVICCIFTAPQQMVTLEFRGGGISLTVILLSQLLDSDRAVFISICINQRHDFHFGM